MAREDSYITQYIMQYRAFEFAAMQIAGKDIAQRVTKGLLLAKARLCD